MSPPHSPTGASFASDNYAGAHPQVIEAIARANSGHAGAYGGDEWTARLQRVVRAEFGELATAYPVLTGTGANVVALTAMLPRWGAVVAADHAHINVDENGALERLSGVKVLGVQAPDGKVTPEALRRELGALGNVHAVQPLAVSLTQCTELGTIYSADELREVADLAHAHGMGVHLDGARLANAAVALDAPLRALTTDVGVDVVSFGGTKNGLLLGELVVVLDPAVAPGVEYVRKFTAQLASKQRYLSAQFLALLEGGLWRTLASHANAMARRLRTRLEGEIAAGRAPGLTFTQPTEANALYAALPAAAAALARARFPFYDWDTSRDEVRWMCSWDTTEADVDAFADALVAALASERENPPTPPD